MISLKSACVVMIVPDSSPAPKLELTDVAVMFAPDGKITVIKIFEGKE